MSKKQWKSIDVPLQFSIKSDWSQEEVDSPLSDVHSIRSSLPTKTNASRQTAELDNIPENGPFILNFANMPFEATEAELKQFFRAYEIYHIELNNPRRGCGHIEFTNINDLAGAWKMNEKTFLNRPLRLSIPLKEDMARQQAMSNKPKFQSQQKQPSTLNSDESDNWRVKKPQQQTQKEAISVSGKPEDKSAWRTRTARTEDNTSSDTGEQSSAWRTKTPRDPVATKTDDNSAWRSQASRDTTGPKSMDTGSNEKSSPWRNRGQREPDNAAKPSSDNIDDKVNWRQRGNQQPMAIESHVDSDSGGDNWRKVGSGVSEVRALPAREERRDSDKIKVSQEEQSVDGETKKKSVFGDARPVDTSAKDLAIEAKLENTKLSLEQPRQEPAAGKNIAWNKKATTTTADKVAASSMEWRDKKPVTIVPVKDKTDGAGKAIAAQSPKKSEPAPISAMPAVAPPPPVNVWKERMKSKTGSSSDSGSSSVPEKVSVQAKMKEVCVKKETDEVGWAGVEEEDISVLDKKTEEWGKEVDKESGGVGGQAEKRSEGGGGQVDQRSGGGGVLDEHRSGGGGQPARQAVVISANGPYLNPRSHRAPPVAIVEGPQSSPGDHNRTVGTGSCQSSWARGPPRSLIEGSSDRQ